MSLDAPRYAAARARRALCFVLALLPAFAVHASEGQRGRTIEVVGEASIEVQADLAQIDLGVVADAESAAAASRKNAEQMERVIAALRQTVKDAAIQTGTYSIQPLYAESRGERGTPRISGFVVSNVVHVRTTARDRAGALIDAAMRAGANQVQRLAFTLEHDAAPRKDALRRAAVQAHEKAEVIAGALGVRLGAVRSATEQDLGTSRPLARSTAMLHAESAPLTPIEPGTVEVRARVALVIDIDATAGAPQSAR